MKRVFIQEMARCSLALTLLVPSLSMAASLEPTAAPSDAASAVYSTDAVYNRLLSGATGVKRSGAFSEPSAGPADNATKTLDEIMAAAPAPDNANGATQDEVKSGKTFWGLRPEGTWGPKTGTATPAAVPKSGQTACYNAAGAAIACAGTGQDGDKQKGVALPTPRFTNNNNGTVTDNLTGLIWLTNANCKETVGGIVKTAGSLTWANALAWSNSLANGNCGLSDGSAAGDWRLPNLRELLSLINYEYNDPALSNTAGTAKWTEGNPFTGVPSNYYWSSTNVASYPGNALTVNHRYGIVTITNKTNSNYVWPIRGGQQ